MKRSEVSAPQGAGYADVVSTNTSDDYKKAVWDAQMRTQVIWAPKWTKKISVVNSLKDQLCEAVNDKISNVVEAIYRDHLDDQRFYIRYTSLQNRQLVAASGFNFGATKVPKELSIFKGMIADVPPNLTVEIMQIILQRYGELHEIRFANYPGTSICKQRLFFSYKNINDNHKVPEVIEIDGIPLTICDLSARKQCSCCTEFGHEAFQCDRKDSGVSSQCSSDEEKKSPRPRRKRKKSLKQTKNSAPPVDKPQVEKPQERPEKSYCEAVQQTNGSSTTKPTIEERQEEPPKTEPETPITKRSNKTDSVPAALNSQPFDVQEQVPSHPELEAESERRETRLGESVEEERLVVARQQEKIGLLEFFKVWDKEIYKKNWEHLNTY